MTDPIACSVLKCMAVDVHPVEWCEREKHCAFAFQRRREQDRSERDRKDRREPIKPPVNPARSRAMKITFVTDAVNDPFANLPIGAAADAAVDAFLEGAIPVIREAVSNRIDRKASLRNSDGLIVGEVEVLRA